ncbi:C2 domain-containing protein 3 [Arapaima gigas]
MRSKNIKPSKVGSKKKKIVLNVPSDVTPSTSLPPLVEGQLRCFLRVTVSRVLWTVSKPPSAVIIQLRWWGESSGGTVFLPQSGSGPEHAAVRTTTRYAIRCGPKQFTSYLTDMGTLVLEAHAKPDHFPIGRVQIPGIAQLSMSRSISGYFTLVSPTSEKLGEVQVSLTLEPLTDAYDNSSSVPTTDVNVNVAIPELCSTSKPTSNSDYMLVPSSSACHSASDGKKSKGSNWPNTPRGKDHVYFQANDSSEKDALSSEIKTEVIKKPRPSSSRSLNKERLSHAAVQGLNSSSHRPDTDLQNSKDILSVLLDRGSKLRNAMMVSALKSKLDSNMTLRDIPLPMPKDNITAITALPSMPSGKLLQDILHSEPSLIYPQVGQQISEETNHILTPHTEDRAIELLLGSPNGMELPFWDGEGSPPELPSETSSIGGDSELGDPHYDQSLLENLFYRGPMLDTSSSDSEGEKEDMSLRKKQQKKGPSEGSDLAEHSAKSPIKKSVGVVQEGSKHNPKDGAMPSLSLDRISMLGQVRVARVLVHLLNIPIQFEVVMSHKIPTKGKPPHPSPRTKCTYFVEYFFPIASAKHDGGPVTMTTELTRLASSTVAGGGKFSFFFHHKVFPVQFNSTTIECWWNTDLTFTIYSRKSFQKKPIPVGKAILPLRSLLQSEHLSESRALPVLGLEEDVKVGQRSSEMGPLKVSVELDVGKKGFSPSGASKAPSQNPSSLNVKNALLFDDSNTQVQGPSLGKNDASIGLVEKQTRDLTPVQDKLCYPPHSTHHVGNHFQHYEGENNLLLHALLMVPDGRNFSCRTPNVYLVCKLFGADESTRSAISWGPTNPTFNFIQVAPVAITSELLERMKNNVMIIEVWQKRGTMGHDLLLGLVKLPLHQFYMSYRDPKIAHLLLRAQYPVVGVDSYMPVVDVSSGSSHGCLRVLLAMGQAEQIAFLQRMRGDELVCTSQPLRPFHLLDPTPPLESKVEVEHSECMTEHVFEVRVERVKGLMPLQSTVWGEADCYIQYSFPARDTRVLHSSEFGVGLTQFRTATTLCVPDPVFSHDETHTLLAPVGVPIQRLLVQSFSVQGTDARAGVHFEVWCRYYYPNVRDQVVAKGLLPLSKLCAMVTMQSEGQMGPQVFSLPLVPRSESSTGCQPQPSGLIDVCIHYKHRLFRTEDLRGGHVAPRVVMLTVQIHRAAGLQAAVQAVMKNDERFQYYSNVGVNSYVAVELSFLPESKRRSTRVVARSFCPEFQHHMEFPCSLLTHKVYGETRSLAELLDSATVVFTVYHREGHRVNYPVAKDTVLGIVKIQLTDLIHKQTGISGWFSLLWPQDSEMLHGHHSSVGGLELSINFAHDADRELVISSARALGWEVDGDQQEREEGLWSDRGRTVSLAISVPRLWIPFHCLQLPNQKDLERSTYCYIRYKLYDRDAFCSPLRHPCLEEKHRGEDNIATVAFKSCQTVELKCTPPLRWYLLEESLEIQMWVAFGKDKRPCPHDSDRLVGSAYVDLSLLTRRGQHKLTITGVYPLFKRSAPNLSGAAIRVHITMTHNVGTSLPREPNISMETENENSSTGLEEAEQDDCPLADTPGRLQRQTSTGSEISSSQKAELDAENTFAVSIIVERAMHLSLKGSPLTEHNGAVPCCCVSYSTADASSPITTPVVQDCDCPVWDHQQESRLSKQLLMDPQQTLVFKVWHKGDVERVIGFTSVDLSPLLAGFQSVCGWYNITNFNGQCQGQLKVSISPLEGVQDLRAQRKAVNVVDPIDAVPSPVYHTSAMYSSFPTHISRYPEQRIVSTPDPQEAIFSERSSVGHYEEHMFGVRMHHESLSEGQELSHGCTAGDNLPSSSALFSALRKNLSELDDIQRYFNHKLCAPMTLSMPLEDQCSQLEGQRESQTDATQLLLKSCFVVREVNRPFIDLEGNCMLSSKDVFSDPVSNEEQFLSTAENKTAQVLSVQTVPEDFKDRDCPPASPVPENEEIDSDMFTTKEACDYEGEGKGCHNGDEEEEEDEEEYEESVIEPRTLNEFTSLTDKTSPWTSALSEPDLASLESLEEAEEQPAKDCPQDEPCRPGSEEALELETPHAEQRGCQFTEPNKEKALSLLAEEQSKSLSASLLDQPLDNEVTANKVVAVLGQNEHSEELSPRLHVSEDLLDVTDSHSEIACSSTDDNEIQILNPVEIPNFFLPAHHMEASMRALRLAPVFPAGHPVIIVLILLKLCLSFQDQRPDQPMIPFPRAPRSRPNLSSTSKEETKRIAKIFASRFSDD